MGARIINITKSENVFGSRAMEDPFVSDYQKGILEPTYKPLMLISLVEQSSVLPQCIGAMVSGVEKEHIFEEREQGKGSNEEWDRVSCFLDGVDVNGQHSFLKLRALTRKDLETTGNAYWEVVRNVAGEVAGLCRIPANTIRLTSLDPSPQEITIKQVWDGAILERTAKRCFRRLVQIRDNKKIWFREWGDPRYIDIETGNLGMDVPFEKRGSELIHFKLESTQSPYGIPRWTGVMSAVAGVAAAEEVNFTYFDRKAIPSMIIMVSGGALGDNSADVIREFMDSNMSGRGSFHSALVLEAESSQASSMLDSKIPTAKIDVKPLRDAQEHDAQFLGYEESNFKKIRSAFRLPPLLIGMSDDYTKATAMESLRMAEDQVFRPERDDFDHFMTRFFVQEFDLRTWVFKTRGIEVTDSAEITGFLDAAQKNAALSPDEVRRVLQKPLGLDLDSLPEGIGEVPIQFYSGASDVDDFRIVKSLWGIRESLLRRVPHGDNKSRGH